MSGYRQLTKEDTSMSDQERNRRLVPPNRQRVSASRRSPRGLILGAVIAVAASLTACANPAGPTSPTGDAAAPQHAQVARKSASDMTAAEIDRFERAFSYAVGKGYFDAFNDEHFNHQRNRMHGAELTATAPIGAMAGESIAWEYRLLPWHRAFILEAEQMLRAALRQRDRTEGRDPSEANSLFIPYWDATHEQALPGWVRAFQPQGGTAIVPEGVPKGHPAYGKPVGSRYNIRFGRWPGTNIVFDKLPQPPQIAGILAHDDYAGFTQAIDTDATLLQSALPAAKQGLQTLKRKFPDNTDVQAVEAAESSPPQDINAAVKLVNAILGVGYLATSQTAGPHPDQEVISAVKAVYAAFISPPHAVLHLWAGGLDPANPDVRGTVSYFNELAVDPVFWMLHTELDHWWYTWQQSHTGVPQLTGDDAQFQPLTPQEGAWYGGGRTYSLTQLTPTQDLPYRYAEPYRA
ncbi:MAG: tyrosinase family protein [Pseudonocardiales bacterium]|nr:tyrosinase family protein [Pseudonocardiales bacterium]